MPRCKAQGLARRRSRGKNGARLYCGVNAIPCRGYNPSVFSACKTSRKASSPCTGEPRTALRLPTVGRTKILSVICHREAATNASFPCKQGEPSGCHRFHLRGSRDGSAARRRFTRAQAVLKSCSPVLKSCSSVLKISGRKKAVLILSTAFCSD